MYTDNQLVKALYRQDRGAQQTFHKKFYGKIMSICMRYSKSNEEAEELNQRCFFHIFNTTVKKPTETLSKFAKRCTLEVIINDAVKNKTIYKLSKQHSDLKLLNEDYTLDKDFVLKDVDVIELIENIQKLNDLERFVFNANFIDGISLKRIKQLLKVDEDTSRYILQKAKLNLKYSLFEETKVK
jgi:RNA polymerase sigma-70 factor (ECF subfamily)